MLDPQEKEVQFSVLQHSFYKNSAIGIYYFSKKLIKYNFKAFFFLFFF